MQGVARRTSSGSGDQALPATAHREPAAAPRHGQGKGRDVHSAAGGDQKAGSWPFSNARKRASEARPNLCELPGRSPMSLPRVLPALRRGLPFAFAPLAGCRAPSWPSSRLEPASTAATPGSLPAAREGPGSSQRAGWSVMTPAQALPRCRCSQSGQGAPGWPQHGFKIKVSGSARRGPTSNRLEAEQLLALGRGGDAERPGSGSVKPVVLPAVR